MPIGFGEDAESKWVNDLEIKQSRNPRVAPGRSDPNPGEVGDGSSGGPFKGLVL